MQLGNKEMVVIYIQRHDLIYNTVKYRLEPVMVTYRNWKVCDVTPNTDRPGCEDTLPFDAFEKIRQDTMVSNGITSQDFHLMLKDLYERRLKAHD